MYIHHIPKPAHNPNQRLVLNFRSEEFWSDAAEAVVAAANASLPADATRDDVIALLNGPEEVLKAALVGTSAESITKSEVAFANLLATIQAAI